MLHQKETERCSYSRTEMKHLRLSKNPWGLGWENPMFQCPFLAESCRSGPIP